MAKKKDSPTSVILLRRGNARARGDATERKIINNDEPIDSRSIYLLSTVYHLTTMSSKKKRKRSTTKVEGKEEGKKLFASEAT